MKVLGLSWPVCQNAHRVGSDPEHADYLISDCKKLKTNFIIKWMMVELKFNAMITKMCIYVIENILLVIGITAFV